MWLPSPWYLDSFNLRLSYVEILHEAWKKGSQGGGRTGMSGCLSALTSKDRSYVGGTRSFVRKRERDGFWF